MEATVALLRRMNIGNGVAETDDALSGHFLRTQLFADFILDKQDIILGEKGAGKTAIYRSTRDQKLYYPEMNHIHLVLGFNEVGVSLFSQLAGMGAKSEVALRKIWKIFFLGVAGNALIDSPSLVNDRRAIELKRALEKLRLRQTGGNLSQLLLKIEQIIDRPIKITLKSKNNQGSIEIDEKIREKSNETTQNIGAAWSNLNSLLTARGEKIWIMVDRLDEAFSDHPEIESIGLKALCRAYLDLREFDKLRIKIFFREDLFRKIVRGGFVNATHLQPRAVRITWKPEDLFSMLCGRIRGNNELMVRIVSDVRNNDSTVFSRVFCDVVPTASGDLPTWEWMMKRIEDGNGTRSPRNLIDLVNKAREHQIKKDERSSRRSKRTTPLIEAEALQKAFEELSEMRVSDTLFAENANLAHIFDVFRGGKAVYDFKSLGVALNSSGKDLEEMIQSLLGVGFLSIYGKSYRIPVLYRPGLGIASGTM